MKTKDTRPPPVQGSRRAGRRGPCLPLSSPPTPASTEHIQAHTSPAAPRLRLPGAQSWFRERTGPASDRSHLLSLGSPGQPQESKLKQTLKGGTSTPQEPQLRVGVGGLIPCNAKDRKGPSNAPWEPGRKEITHQIQTRSGLG